jgi:misacylated tRNA(Ala) deacylase
MIAGARQDNKFGDRCMYLVNTTDDLAQPRGMGDIRMIRVEGVDFQPCGGTHVGNTREIGAARVSKIENKGKRNRNRRIQIVLDSG